MTVYDGSKNMLEAVKIGDERHLLGSTHYTDGCPGLRRLVLITVPLDSWLAGVRLHKAHKGWAGRQGPQQCQNIRISALSRPPTSCGEQQPLFFAGTHLEGAKGALSFLFCLPQLS
jgi:hypothetical protein